MVRSAVLSSTGHYSVVIAAWKVPSLERFGTAQKNPLNKLRLRNDSGDIVNPNERHREHLSIFCSGCQRKRLRTAKLFWNYLENGLSIIGLTFHRFSQAISSRDWRTLIDSIFVSQLAKFSRFGRVPQVALIFSKMNFTSDFSTETGWPRCDWRSLRARQSCGSHLKWRNV